MAVPKGTRIGGRQKGTPNKATADVKEAAQAYTAEAVQALAQIMRDSDSDAAKVAAIKEILDRGHGKSKQSLEVDATLQDRRVLDRPLTEEEWSAEHPA